MNPEQTSPKNILMYAVTVLVVVLCAVGVAGFAVMVGATNPDRYDNTITVQGTGEVMATPDIAEFSFTIREENKDVTVAQKKVTDTIDMVTNKLLAAGVLEKDIQTQQYSSNPKYEWQTKTVACPVGSYCPQDGKQVLVGYEVYQTTLITLRNFDLTGDVLTIIGQADADSSWGPNLRVEDMDIARATAREEAVNKAKAQAQTLSDQLGVRIIKLTSFSEDGGYGNPVPMYAAMESRDMAYGGDAMVKAVAPSISAGEDKITTTVYLTYKIK